MDKKYRIVECPVENLDEPVEEELPAQEDVADEAPESGEESQE